MTFDPGRGEIVMFGGYPGSIPLGDTWTYGPPAGVEPNWRAKTPETAPTWRTGASMAYDPARGEVVLFGGETSDVLNETWTWDGEVWTKKTPANSPAARAGAGMDFDPRTGEIVLFGGYGEASTLNDTWTWNGENWTQKSPTTSPPVRGNLSMGYDYANGELVLFGGNASLGVLNDTWVWTGGNWVQRSPATSPSSRSGTTLTFDQGSGRLLLFGGNANGPRVNDTWAWNGQNWTELAPAERPSGRALASMEYDPALGRQVLFGGHIGLDWTNDTWAWDGNSWTSLNPADKPGARYEAAMAFDSANGEMVLFGGSGVSGDGQTWTFGLEVENPTAQIDSPDDSGTYGVGEIVPTEFSCSEALGGPGLESCVDSEGSDEPAGELDTATAGVKTYTVTATSANGLTGTTEIGYEVAKAAPAITASTASGATLGEPIRVRAEFTGGYNAGGEIAFSAFGPEDVACSEAPVFESDPVAVTGEGSYLAPDFTPTAAGEYRWVASYSGDTNNEAAQTDCGVTGSVSTVVEPPAPPAPPIVDVDPEKPPVCPSFQARQKLRKAKPKPPFGKLAKVDGLLIELRVGFDADAKLRPLVRYRIAGKARKAKLRVRTVRVNERKLVRLALPAKMRRDFRRAGLKPRGAKVILVLNSRVKTHGAPGSCFQKVPRRTLKLKVTGVSKRAVRP